MESEDRDKITKFRVELRQYVEPKEIVDYLFQERMLHVKDIELISSKPTRYERVNTLLHTLTRRRGAYPVFLKALKAVDFGFLADQLEPPGDQYDYTHVVEYITSTYAACSGYELPLKEIHSRLEKNTGQRWSEIETEYLLEQVFEYVSFETKKTKRNDMYINQRYAVDITKKDQSSVPQSELASEGELSTSEEEGDLEENRPDWLKSFTDERGVVVQMRDYDMEEIALNEAQVYSMRNKAFGMKVLIINNKRFPERAKDTGKKLGERLGTDVDVACLKEVFRQIGFERMGIEENLKGNEIIAILESVARTSCRSDTGFLCVILSHGNTGCVYGTDGDPVKLTDICSKVSGENCQALVGKPKIFIIQACQGGNLDSGVHVEEHDGAQSEILDNVLPWIQPQPMGATGSSLPSDADMLVAYSAMPGYASFRHTEYGTWFIKALVHVLMNNACKEHLVDILVEVNKLVSERATEATGLKQGCEQRNSLRKKLYLFPGL